MAHHIAKEAEMAEEQNNNVQNEENQEQGQQTGEQEGSRKDRERLGGGHDGLRADLVAERRQRHAAEKELEQLRAQHMTESDKAIAAAKADGRKEALEVANDRLLRAEVKAAAGGKLADPGDATRMLDLSEFSVDDDGSVDTKALSKAIDDLIKDKPYLAAARPQGGFDGGARQSPPSPDGDMSNLIRRVAGRA